MTYLKLLQLFERTKGSTSKEMHVGLQKERKERKAYQITSFFLIKRCLPLWLALSSAAVPQGLLSASKIKESTIKGKAIIQVNQTKPSLYLKALENVVYGWNFQSNNSHAHLLSLLYQATIRSCGALQPLWCYLSSFPSWCPAPVSL